MYGHPVTPTKSRLRSKTYWFNLVILALAGMEMQLQVLKPLLPIDVFQLIVFVLPIVNMVLREFTDRGVGGYTPPRRLPPHPGGLGSARPEDYE